MIYYYRFITTLSVLFCLLPGLTFSQTTFQKSYGLTGKQFSGNHLHTISDGYILSGVSNAENTAERPFLMKLKTNGDIIWSKNYGNGITGESISQTIAANDGGFISIGSSNGTNTFWNPAILLIKTDANGNLEWEKILPDYLTGRKNVGTSLVAVGDGYIITGISTKNYSKTVLLRINNQGELVWSKMYSTSNIDQIRFTAGLVSGDTIFASGYRDSIATFSMLDATTGAPLEHTLLKNSALYDKSLPFMVAAANGDLLMSGYAGQDLWVCRMSRAGLIKWSKTYSGVGGGNLVPLSGDNFLLVVQSKSGGGSGSANLDPALLKINGEGDVIWAYQYGMPGYDYFSSAVEMPDGGVMATGGVDPGGNDINEYHILVVRTDKNGLVAGCCRQPINVIAADLPVERSPQTLNMVNFTDFQETEMVQQNDSLVGIDYCPTAATIQNIDVSLCPGDSIVIDGTSYTSAGMVTSILPGSGCDTTVFYNIQLRMQPTLEKAVFLCPGDSVIIHGTAYTDAGIVTDLVPGPECDTLLKYTIQILAQPTLEKTLTFCPGDSLIINGLTFTQPATFTQVIPSATGGCDTLITYHLEYTTPTDPVNLTINCPADLAIQVSGGTTSIPVIYSNPTVLSDCICPGFDLQQTEGPASGSAFPAGSTTLCFTAQDHCGNQTSCCFQVTVTEEDNPCDVKVSGCLRFELQRISADAEGRRTYHLRVQNNCSQALTYVAFQLPAGVIAYNPANNSIYTSPSGRLYTVRNPNASPSHSIRFSAQGTGIQGGESEVFTYTLPPYAAPDYIHTVAKLSGQPSVETHLNTFNCPVEMSVSNPTENRSSTNNESKYGLQIFPNPAETVLFVELNGWNAASTRLQIFNAQGQVVLSQETMDTSLTLSLNLPAGIYLLEARTDSNGQRAAKRFVVR